jgi:hypothetical protein
MQELMDAFNDPLQQQQQQMSDSPLISSAVRRNTRQNMSIPASSEENFSPPGSLRRSKRASSVPASISVSQTTPVKTVTRSSTSFQYANVEKSPFTIKHVQRMLQSLPIDVAKLSGFFDRRTSRAPTLEFLKEIKRNSKTKEYNANKLLNIGSNFCIQRCIGEGAFASVYLVDIADTWEISDSTFAMKIQQPPVYWEFYIAQQIQQRIQPSMQAKFASFRSIYVFSDASFSLMEYLQQGSLLDVINAYKKKGSKNGRNVSNLLHNRNSQNR